MNVDLTPSPSKLIMQVFLARQVQMVSHSLPERDTLSTRRVALSLHLLRFQDQRHPVTARFSPLPFAADCFCFLPPDEAALLFLPLRLLPTPYHPIFGIHHQVELMRHLMVEYTHRPRQ